MKFNCTCCQKPKATLECGACKEPLCKNCAEILTPETFAFLQKIPDSLRHQVYCVPCYDKDIAQSLSNYSQTLEQAKNVRIFFDHQGKETRLLKRKEKPIAVVDCADREETIMRLAFQAASREFNTLVDVHLTSKKVRNHAYQTLIWQGSAVPINT